MKRGTSAAPPEDLVYDFSVTGARDIVVDDAPTGLGWVTSRGGTKHLVRVGCEHWASTPESDDCRYDCNKKEGKGQ